MGVIWSNLILFGMGLIPEKNKTKNIIKNRPYVFVANHVSMIDIFLLVSVLNNNPLVFIGKKELEQIPVFGFLYKKTMILVDRSSNESKKRVFAETRKKLQSGTSLCIFPEGTVPDIDVKLAPFKHGAFTIAIEHKIPIVVLTFLDNKRRFPWTWTFGGLFGGSKILPGKLRVKIHEPIDTSKLSKEDRIRLSEKARLMMINDLQ